MSPHLPLQQAKKQVKCTERCQRCSHARLRVRALHSWCNKNCIIAQQSSDKYAEDLSCTQAPSEGTKLTSCDPDKNKQITRHIIQQITSHAPVHITKQIIKQNKSHAPVHPVVVGSHEDTSPTLWRWAGLTQALDLPAVIHLETSHLL